MKTFRCIILFNLLIIISLSAYSQRQKITFSNGVEDYFELISADYKDMPDRYLTLSPIGFRGGILQPNGPFTLDLNYLKYFDEKQKAINARFYFCPIDIKILEGFDGYKAFPMSVDLQYRYKVLKGTTVVKPEKIVINTNPKLDYNNYTYTYTYYTVKMPLLSYINYYFRSGVFYNQYTWGVSYTLDDQSTLNLDAVKSYSLYAGLSRSKMGHVKFKTDRFGERHLSWMSEIYFDVLYAPIMYGLGSHKTYYDYSTDTGGETINEKYLKSSLENLEKYSSGFRIGRFSRKKMKRVDMLFETKFEFAYYPGYEWQFYYFGVGFGLIWYK